MKRTVALVAVLMLLTAQPAAAYTCEPNNLPTMCLRADLADFGGADRTAAIMGVNVTDGQGTYLAGGNMGVFGVSHGSGYTSTATYNVGVQGQARWASVLSAGVEGVGLDTDGSTTRLNANVVGIYARGQTNGTGYRAGGYFETGRTDPDLTQPGATIVADSRDGSDVASLRVNGSPVITVTNAGALNFQANSGAPANPAVIAAWLHVQLSGLDYWTPLYR